MKRMQQKKHVEIGRVSLVLILAASLSACTGLPSVSIPAPALKIQTTNSIKSVKKSSRPTQTLTNQASLETTQIDSEELEIPTLVSREISSDLWERLPKGFKIPVTNNQSQVQAQINWFMQHQSFLIRTTKRAAPYMYYIMQRIEERNLPAELALLPIIESAYYPLASSGVGATGLWQLMPGTATKFGLKQNLWYDGRRDVFASTNAALDYFTYLDNYFDSNWLLAIAAYNAGEGTIQQAVQRNAMQGKRTDFWSLALPAETMSYVPRLLALAEIIRHPNRYGINLPPINDSPYLVQVAIRKQLPLSLAAQMADMSLLELKQLNPGYKAEPHAPYQLILPVDKVAAFKAKLNPASVLAEETKAAETTETTTVAINTDKTTTLVDEVTDNSNEQNADAPQQAIDEDSNKADADENDNEEVTSTTEPETHSAVTSPVTYIIKAGDTLYKIAKHYQVSIDDVRRWNHLKASQAIKPGNKLVVGKKIKELKTKSTSTQTNPNHHEKRVAKQQNTVVKPSAKTAVVHSYEVKPGDTLTSIAKKFHIKASDLQKLNKLSSTNLHPGQHLQV